jgi:hypothetical protein
MTVTGQGALLGFIVPGLKEIVLIALVALALYGRGGSRLLRATRYGRAVEPWLDLVRVPPRPQDPRRGRSPSQKPPAPEPRRPSRWFWALALTAAAAVAAWVVTRAVVLSGTGVAP